MRRRPIRPPLRSGFDRVGPFHPYLAFGAVILVDLLAVVLIVLALTWVGDTMEDWLWPGGPEWVDF
jgi:hypothetical protein